MTDWRAYWRGCPKNLDMFRQTGSIYPIFDRTSIGERLNGGDSRVVLVLGLDGLPVEDEDYDEA